MSKHFIRGIIIGASPKFLASDCDANCEVESHCESIKENSDGFETCSNDEKCYHGNGTCDPSK